MAEIAADLFQPVDGLDDLPVQHAASFRRYHLAGSPAEQRLADFRFQRRQVLAQRGLRHKTELRRGGYGSVAINRDKRAVPFKICHNFSYTTPLFILLEL